MVIKLLITYQILFINLSLTHLIARKKYNNWIVFGSLAVFTLLLSTVLFLTSPLFIGSQPTVWFILAGLFYIVPLYFLYQIQSKELLTIMLYCWTYTMIITSLSVGLSQLSYLFSDIVEIFLFQTILFILTFYGILRFTKRRFIIIVRDIPESRKNSLIVLGISLFGLTSVARYFLVHEGFTYFLMILFLIISSMSVYNLLYHHVQSSINLHSANQLMYFDTLTGIGNRRSLFRDLHEHIRRNQEFTLLFLDLDDLKLVNDKYGHNKGDEYLIYFAQTLQECTKQSGSSYRFAGDEFVCIITNTNENLDVSYLENTIKSKMQQHVQFNGVSIGLSQYPLDGDDPDVLLQIADSKMYKAKNNKKIRTPNSRVT